MIHKGDLTDSWVVSEESSIQYIMNSIKKTAANTQRCPAVIKLLYISSLHC